MENKIVAVGSIAMNGVRNSDARMGEFVCVIGLGLVGSTVETSFNLKNINVSGYDKFKDGGIGNIDDMFQKDILFLCLPTLFNESTYEYDKKSIVETCKGVVENDYKGVVVISVTGIS